MKKAERHELYKKVLKVMLRKENQRDMPTGLFLCNILTRIYNNVPFATISQKLELLPKLKEFNLFVPPPYRNWTISNGKLWVHGLLALPEYEGLNIFSSKEDLASLYYTRCAILELCIEMSKP